ncbi:MAG: GNAT family N-acetyltransferase, partial [Candidatus Eremiobacteraeota bacterium]|nr:GNAT family N-acetyltransferase [Candidatus Eremiobacteraeota bacterium]
DQGCRSSNSHGRFHHCLHGIFRPLIFADAATAMYLRVHDIVPEASPIWLKDGEPVAIGALGVRGKRGWVGAFGIAPEYRGKGLAQAMFCELVRLARLQGVKEITLEVLEENVRARAIYERAGFKVTRKLFSLECESIRGSNEDAQIAPVAEFIGAKIEGEPAPCWQRESRSIELRSPQLAAVQSGKSFAVYRADGDHASIWKTSLNGGGDAVLAAIALIAGAQTLSVTNEPEGSTLLLQRYDRAWSPTAVQYEMLLTL